MHDGWPHAEVVWCCACLLRMLDDVRRGLSGETTGGDASDLTISSPNNLTIINTSNQSLYNEFRSKILYLVIEIIISSLCIVPSAIPPSSGQMESASSCINCDITMKLSRDMCRFFEQRPRWHFPELV
jgi:hypothetical protein